MKDYTKTIELLKKKAVKDDEAVEILNRALTINGKDLTNTKKVTWAERLTLLGKLLTFQNIRGCTIHFQLESLMQRKSLKI